MIAKAKRNIIAFCLMCVEFYWIYTHKQDIISLISFLKESSVDFYDDLFISLIGAVLFSVLQFINYFLIDLTVSCAQKTIIITAQHIFKYDNKSLQNCISQMLMFMFLTNCRWGVTQKTTVLKNANTAEGLIACANAVEMGMTLSNQETNEIRSVIDYQMSLLREDGYVSFNENEYTVHCTGMVLYAIKKYVDLDIYEISEKDEEKIRICLRKLLNNANELGWGFINKKYDEKDYNRTLSTMWALRALNTWGFSDSKRFKEVIFNLSSHANGRLGFSVDSTEKYSATAMFHIVISELKNEKLKNELMKLFDTKNVLSYLLKGLRHEVEVEEFITSAETAKKLPWTHFSECLALEAAALYLKEMNIAQIVDMSVYIKKIMHKIEPNHHYYSVQSMNFKHTDPFFYPTTYLVSSLCRLSVALNNI